MGYQLNPFSIWYLYSVDMSLATMILEVHSAFDERRMYFLKPTTVDKAGQVEDADAMSNAHSQRSRALDSKNYWPRHIHMSLFSSGEGTCRLVVSDLLEALSEGRNPIDGKITLESSKSHEEVDTRLISDGQPVDPLLMNVVQKMHFLLSWWWMGVVAFSRIIREPTHLWLQGNPPVWYRPVPLGVSLARNANIAERTMEISFRRYLRSLVEQCQVPIALKYVPCGISDLENELILSPSAKAKQDNSVEEIEFKTLTPAFYTRFAFYAHDLEALFSELRESCTIWVSRPDLLPKLLFRKPTSALEARGITDFLYFEAIRYLRRRPERIMQALTPSQRLPTSSTRATIVDIRNFRISAMDAFVLRQDDAKMRRRYRSLVLRLFVAERFAFGRLLLVDATLILLETWLTWNIAFAWEGRTRILALAGTVWAYGYWWHG